MQEDTRGADVLLTTKLYPPRSGAAVIPRPRLIQILSGRPRTRLVLVTGPAGSGKTTLVGDWLSNPPGGHAWLSLDPSDNDPLRFWSYLLAALRSVAPEVGATAASRLSMAGTDVVRDVLPHVVNDIVRLDSDIVVVLDDYHSITDRAVHDSMSRLIDWSPPQLRLVIVTRADPPLPIARLRARGDLLEVRAEELRFTRGESGELLTAALHLNLAPADVDRLQERTEGWAAGLQLAALSLRNRPDTSAFVARFAGDDRHIVDYLGQEVLATLPEDLREFLLHTSVLRRLSGPLCDHVTGRTESAQLLDRVESANLFLIPLDESRTWFRYHHLFGQLARHELSRTQPHAAAELNRRAAQWYRSNDDVIEAVASALAAGDTDMARGIVAEHWRRFFNAGRLATVTAWLNALPPDIVAVDPELSVARLWIGLDTGRLDEVNHWLDVTEAALPDDPRIALIRCLSLFKGGDVYAANRLAARWNGPTDGFWGTVANCALGATAFWLGKADEARDALQRAATLAIADGNQLARVYALGYQALWHALREERSAAERLVDDAEAIIEEDHLGGHFVAMMPALARAHVEESRDENRASAAAERALTLAARGAGHVERAAALITVARLHRGPGDVPEQQLREAQQLLRNAPAPGEVALVWLTAAERVTGHLPSSPGAVPEPLTDRELAILRRLPARLSQRELAEVLYLSPNTVKTHLRAIYRKLGAGTRAEAVVQAREAGLL